MASGGYGPLVAEQMAQKGVQDVARQRQLQDESRQNNLAYYGGILNNPNATDDQKLQAHQAIQSLYPTPAHAPQFLVDLLHLKGRQQQPQQAQSQANAATNTPPQPAVQGPPSVTPAGATESTSPALNPPQTPAAASPQGPTPAAAPAASVPPQPSTQQATPSIAQVRAVGQAQSPEEALSLARAYASPQQIQNDFAMRMANLNAENQMRLWGQRGQTAVDVATIRAQYAMLNTPQKMFLESQAQSMGYPSFLQVPPQLQGGMLTSFREANAPQIQAVTVQDANSPTGFSRATYNPVTQQTYDVYPGITPPRGFVPTHRVTQTPGPNGIVTTVSEITPGIGPSQPFTPPPVKGEKQSTAGGPQGTPKAAPVSGPTAGISTPPEGGQVADIGGPVAAPTAAAAPPQSTASANQSALNKKLNQKRSQSRQIPAPQASGGEEAIPPLRNPALPPMKGADEQRVASIAAPMATVEQQVVGRGVKPLWEYSNVLKNPDLLKAVNYAMLAPMLQTPEGEKGVSFWGTISTALGLASAAQQVTSDTITQARQRIQQEGGPEAVEFLDRLAELKGAIPNLRKVQGGSSALGAIEPLYQESPIMNISSPEDFRNRTANMLRTMATALNEAPGINKKHVDWLYKQADLAQGKGGTSAVNDFLTNFRKKGS